MHLPGGYPLDMVLAVASGEMASGLLGTTSLTYQLVGQPVAVVKELVQAQPELRIMVSALATFLLGFGYVHSPTHPPTHPRDSRGSWSSVRIMVSAVSLVSAFAHVSTCEFMRWGVQCYVSTCSVSW